MQWMFKKLMLTVSALQDILSKDENIKEAKRNLVQSNRNSQKNLRNLTSLINQLNQNNLKLSMIRLWTAWQSLSRKIAELGSNKEAKKQLLEIADQAIAAIQES